MTMLIEDNVPPPRGPLKRTTKYALERFKPGQSVVIPPHMSAHEFTALRRAAWSYGRAHGMKFTTGYDEQGVLRLWRLS